MKYSFNNIIPVKTPLNKNIKLRKQKRYITENNF